MKCLLLLSVVAFASTNATAQDFRPPPLGTYDVKGVWLGATKQELLAVLPAEDCKPYTPSDSDPSQTSCSTKFNPVDRGEPDSFAGKKTAIWYHLYNDHVAEISFPGFFADDFDSIVEAMTQKYGMPVVTHSQVQNRMGATFDDATADWTNGKGDRIHFIKRSPTNLNYGFIEFESADFAAWKKQHAEEKSKAAKSDM